MSMIGRCELFYIDSTRYIQEAEMFAETIRQHASNASKNPYPQVVSGFLREYYDGY